MLFWRKKEENEQGNYQDREFDEKLSHLANEGPIFRDYDSDSNLMMLDNN